MFFLLLITTYAVVSISVQRAVGGPWNTGRSGNHYYLCASCILPHLLIFKEEHSTERWKMVHTHPLPPNGMIRPIRYWIVAVCNSGGHTSHRSKHGLARGVVVVFRPNLQLLISVSMPIIQQIRLLIVYRAWLRHLWLPVLY